MRRNLIFLILAVLVASPASAKVKEQRFVAEVWADNWFEIYVNGKRIGADSEPFSTERSFNSDQIEFSASYPFTVGIVARDYVEDASGLEYIGTSRQQIGDGGIIFQIKEMASGKVISSSNGTWRVLLINKAPINVDCVNSKSPIQDCISRTIRVPKYWSSNNYNSSKWARASIFSEGEVGVKEGFYDFDWAPNAKLVWSSDLKLDNTILIRKTIRN